MDDVVTKNDSPAGLQVYRDGVAPCWCGERNPLFDEAGLDETCGGLGVLYCWCGGDLCACHHHGEVECPACDDCRALDDEVPHGREH